jgi:hypothetical protein
MRSTLIGLHQNRVAALAAGDEFGRDAALGVHFGVGLADIVTAFLHRREIDHLVRRATVLHLAIRAFDEAVRVDARVGGQRVDQTDIRTFGGSIGQMRP